MSTCSVWLACETGMGMSCALFFSAGAGGGPFGEMQHQATACDAAAAARSK